MRRHPDGDQNVANSTRTGQSLPLEADLLALAEPGRNLDIDLLSGRQVHASGRAFGGFGERDHDFSRHIVAGGLHILRRETGASPPAAAGRAAEHAAEHIVEIGEAARPARAPHALRPE